VYVTHWGGLLHFANVRGANGGRSRINYLKLASGVKPEVHVVRPTRVVHDIPDKLPTLHPLTLLHNLPSPIQMGDETVTTTAGEVDAEPCGATSSATGMTGGASDATRVRRVHRGASSGHEIVSGVATKP
jgi:hypothetical protein